MFRMNGTPGVQTIECGFNMERFLEGFVVVYSIVIFSVVVYSVLSVFGDGVPGSPD